MTHAEIEAQAIGDESPLVAMVKHKEDLQREIRRNDRKLRRLILAQINTPPVGTGGGQT